MKLGDSGSESDQNTSRYTKFSKNRYVIKIKKIMTYSNVREMWLCFPPVLSQLRVLCLGI